MENKDKTQQELLSELASANKRAVEAEAMAEKYASQVWSLKASEERYRHMVENVNSIMLVMDTKGKIVFLNQFALRFFGYYEKDIIGQNVIGTIVSEKDLSGKDLVQMIKDIVENPERHSVNENENIRRNGERVQVLWTNKAIVDDNGKIREILCVGNAVKTS